MNTADKEYLKQLGARLIDDQEPGDFGLSEEAKAIIKAGADEDLDSLKLVTKALAENYCIGYALGYLRASGRRVVTAEAEIV